MSDRLALKEQLVEEFEVGVAKQEKQLRDNGLVMRSTQTGKYLEAEVLERWIKNMDHVRKNISEVRLNFIKTLDKHTEIDMVAENDIVNFLIVPIKFCRKQKPWKIWEMD